MKNNIIQSWRGLAIIAVLLIHHSFLKYNDDVFSLTRPMLNFSVPVFFFISGYFAKFESKVNWRAVSRIAIPYAIWSIINYWCNCYFCHKHGDTYFYEATDLWKMIFFGQTSMQMYYLVVLLELVLLTPLIYRFRNSKICKAICLFATPVSIVISHVGLFIPAFDQMYLSCTFIGWLTYYYWGIQFKQTNHLKLFNNTTLLLLAFICLMLNVVEIQLISKLLTEGMSPVLFGFFNVSLFFYVFSVVHILKNEIGQMSINARVRTFLSQIGDYSFFIYLSHLQIFRGGYFAASLINPLKDDSMSSMIISNILLVFFTIVFSIAIAKIAEKILPTKIVKYIGIR